MSKTPCYFCDKETPGRRHPGCHADCKDFKDWRAEEEAKKAKIAEDRKNAGLDQYISYQSQIKKQILRRAGKP